MGQTIFYIGLGIAFIGLCIWGATKIGIPLGKLPGDISYQGENSSFYFPIVTCIVLSIVLTVLFNLISWVMNKWN